MIAGGAQRLLQVMGGDIGKVVQLPIAASQLFIRPLQRHSLSPEFFGPFVDAGFQEVALAGELEGGVAQILLDFLPFLDLGLEARHRLTIAAKGHVVDARNLQEERFGAVQRLQRDLLVHDRFAHGVVVQFADGTQR